MLLPDLPPGALVPARGQILVTEAVGEVVRHPFGTNFDKEYGRQTATGQILCGGYRRLDINEGLGSYEERVTPAGSQRDRLVHRHALPATRFAQGRAQLGRDHGIHRRRAADDRFVRRSQEPLRRGGFQRRRLLMGGGDRQGRWPSSFCMGAPPSIWIRSIPTASPVAASNGTTRSPQAKRTTRANDTSERAPNRH